MKFDSVRVVLVETSHPGNIGSTARAMKTMGLHRLYLVNPRLFPDQRAHVMAAGADDLLSNAVVTGSLTEAIRDCKLVMATSARPRGIALAGLTPSQNAEFISHQEDHTEIALVFGREHAGLTNDELLHCHYHIHIPSNPAFSSLNLAQAVQIIVYELRMRLLAPSATVGMSSNNLATADEIEQFYSHLRDTLIEIEFLKPENPKRLMQRLRRLFNRIRLEHLEVNILRGILSQFHYALTNKSE
ncbi:MAG: RNA methyltransferase [Legionella sp.]